MHGEGDIFNLDQEVRGDIIRGVFPVRFVLDSREIAGARNMTPLFVAVPRVSYIHQFFSLARDHFQSVLIPSFGQKRAPWAEFREHLLDWRIPLGVQFDAMCDGGDEPPYTVKIHFHFQKRHTPWLSARVDADQNADENIRVPVDQSDVQPYGSSSQWLRFQEYFMNCFRQALYVLHGSARSYQGVPKRKQIQLYEALQTCDIRSFDEISTDVSFNCRTPSASSSSAAPHTRMRRRLPLVLHFFGPPMFKLELAVTTQAEAGEIRVYDLMMTELPVFLHDAIRTKAVAEITAELSAAAIVDISKVSAKDNQDYIRQLLKVRDPFVSTDLTWLPGFPGSGGPLLEPEPKNFSGVDCEAVGLSRATTLMPHPLRASKGLRACCSGCRADGTASPQVSGGEVKIVVQGVTVPVLAPLLWLFVHCRYLDNRLHILVKLASQLVFKGVSSDS